MAKKEKTISPYTLLSRWLFDGSKTSKIPDEVVKNKSIGSQYILYYFLASPYIKYISNTFNNYNVYQLDRLEVFKLIKEAVILCGFKPPYMARFNNSKTKLITLLKQKFPYLKYDDVNLLANYIDESDLKDTIYEMFGLTKPKKNKTKKSDIKQISTKVEQSIDKVDIDFELDEIEEINQGFSWTDLMKNFVIEEI